MMSQDKPYSQEEMEHAILNVMSGKMTLSDASRTCNIPFSILRHKMTERHPVVPGPKYLFTKPEEAKLVAWIQSLGAKCQGKDIKNKAKEILELRGDSSKIGAKRPGKDWLLNFLRRHPEINWRKPLPVKKDKTEATLPQAAPKLWFEMAHTEPADAPLTITTENRGIRTVCLNNPRKRNALSLAMLKSLKHELTRDPDGLRVIILKANGPVFSAGHDLTELTADTGRAYHEEIFSSCSSLMNLIQDHPCPVIAQVHGLATAAGCQLVATCDIAVVSTNSRFATPGVNVGLFCTTPGVALGRSVPRKKAMEMLFTGHPISAQDALLHGLVSKVVPEDELEIETRKIAEKICDTSKSVTALGKASFYAQMALERREAYRFAERIMVENLSIQDGKEGIDAFIKKRKPEWSS